MRLECFIIRHCIANILYTRHSVLVYSDDCFVPLECKISMSCIMYYYYKKLVATITQLSNSSVDVPRIAVTFRLQ